MNYAVFGGKIERKSRPKRLELVKQYSNVPPFKDVTRGILSRLRSTYQKEASPYTPTNRICPIFPTKNYKDLGFFVKGF